MLEEELKELNDDMFKSYESDNEWKKEIHTHMDSGMVIIWVILLGQQAQIKIFERYL